MQDVVQNIYFQMRDSKILLAALTRALGSPYSTSVSLCLKQILAAVEATRTIRELTVLISPEKSGWLVCVPREEQLTERAIRELSEELEIRTVVISRTAEEPKFHMDVYLSGAALHRAQSIEEDQIGVQLHEEGIEWTPLSFTEAEAAATEAEWVRKRYRLL